MTSTLRAAGHYVIILTDCDKYNRDERVKELASLGIDYDELNITGKNQEYMQENDVDYAVDDDRGYYSALSATPIFVVSRDQGAQ